ncbi:HlyD family secretion protein [Ammoniphilus sp. 3BR4]|uniref:HlyD family secretion protein n=1 Tax=Ammoniphilus sp. 3BR4 TaxID=3158265 RepID=UPI003466E305
MMPTWKWILVAISFTGLLGCSRTETELYSGTIEGVEVPVLTEIGGTILELGVKEGQKVTKGEILAVLDQRLIHQQILEAEAFVESAQAQLDEAHAGTRGQELSKSASLIEQNEAQIRQLQMQQEKLKAGIQQKEAMLEQVGIQWKGAKSSLQFQMDKLKDLEALAGHGAVAEEHVTAQRETVQQAAIAVETLQSQKLSQEAQLAIAIKEWEAMGPQIESIRAQVKSAQAQYHLLKEGATSHTLKQLEAQKKMAVAKLEQAKIQESKALIHSPVDGVVARKNIALGEVVKPSYQLFTLLEADQLELTVYIPENRLNLVKSGQSVEVTVDAYPGETFQGKVIHISEQAEFTPKNVQTAAERTKMVFAVTLQMVEGLDKLKPGMPADVPWNGGQTP